MKAFTRSHHESDINTTTAPQYYSCVQNVSVVESEKELCASVTLERLPVNITVKATVFCVEKSMMILNLWSYKLLLIDTDTADLKKKIADSQY